MSMTIQEAAKRINRSPKTILGWEDQGLIEPARDDRGWRVFTEQDIERMEEIKGEKRERMIAGKAPEEAAADVQR